MSHKVTVADTLEMSVDERLELVADIWESIEALPEAISLDDFERQELERRLAAYRADPGRAAPWEVVRQRLQNRARPR